MTLTTHAVAGAALASLMPSHPLFGFAAGFASHFALDAIPHYDYKILSDAVNPDIGASLRPNRALLLDLVRIGADAILGVGLSLLLFFSPAALPAVMCGAVGGIAPDVLQFVYGHWRHEPLVSLQRFHQWIHTKRRLRLEGKVLVGVLSQALLLAAIIVVAIYI